MFETGTEVDYREREPIEVGEPHDLLVFIGRCARPIDAHGLIQGRADSSAHGSLMFKTDPVRLASVFQRGFLSHKAHVTFSTAPRTDNLHRALVSLWS